VFVSARVSDQKQRRVCLDSLFSEWGISEEVFVLRADAFSPHLIYVIFALTAAKPQHQLNH